MTATTLESTASAQMELAAAAAAARAPDYHDAVRELTSILKGAPAKEITTLFKGGWLTPFPDAAIVALLRGEEQGKKRVTVLRVLTEELGPRVTIAAEEAAHGRRAQRETLDWLDYVDASKILTINKMAEDADQEPPADGSDELDSDEGWLGSGGYDEADSTRTDGSTVGVEPPFGDADYGVATDDDGAIVDAETGAELVPPDDGAAIDQAADAEKEQLEAFVQAHNSGPDPSLAEARDERARLLRRAIRGNNYEGVGDALYTWLRQEAVDFTDDEVQQIAEIIGHALTAASKVSARPTKPAGELPPVSDRSKAAGEALLKAATEHDDGTLVLTQGARRRVATELNLAESWVTNRGSYSRVNRCGRALRLAAGDRKVRTVTVEDGTWNLVIEPTEG